MAPNPIMIPRKPVPAPEGDKHTEKKNKNNRAATTANIAATTTYAAVIIALAITTRWARHWLLSGAGLQTFILFFADAQGSRVFPTVALWALLSALNLAYAVCSTSWLLFGLFVAFLYPVILLTCLFQFPMVANFARKRLRLLLRQLHFVNDKIALFNIPALEIDTDVSGLFVARGVTISLSSLTIVAHGIELGIKLNDEMELAIHVDEVAVALFRRIDIGEVYGNLKGGENEMTFHGLNRHNDGTNEDDVFNQDTPLLRAATGENGRLAPPRPKLTSRFTGGRNPTDSSAKAGMRSITQLSPDDEKAAEQYDIMLQHIHESSAVEQARTSIRDHNPDTEEERAVICARLHKTPSVPHPPQRSVKVTTLQKLTPPYLRNFLHRLPFLLRLLLAVLSYFHTIFISAITVAGSGVYMNAMINQEFFKDYTDGNAELRRIERRIARWVADANFAVELTDITSLAQVPLDSSFNITTYLRFADVMAHRTLPEQGTTAQVVRLGGADATFTFPTYLLPHHEHIIPQKASQKALDDLAHEVDGAQNKPEEVQRRGELQQAEKDEANIELSVHVSLPAVFDQELLNFVAALVKATKVIEIEKSSHTDEPMIVMENSNATDSEADETASIASVDTGNTETPASSVSPTSTRFKNFARAVQKSAREGLKNTGDSMKKAAIGGVINDRWIAKLVGKIASKLEGAQGDVGYSGVIPVRLEMYRPEEGVELPSKLLV